MGEYNEASNSRMMVQEFRQQNNMISSLYKDVVDFEFYRMMWLLEWKCTKYISHVINKLGGALIW